MKNTTRELLEKRIFGTLALEPEKASYIFSTLDLDDFSVYRQQVSVLYDCWKEQKDHYVEFQKQGLKASQIVEAIQELPAAFFYQNACTQLKEIALSERLKHILTTASKEVPTEKVDQFIADIQQRLAKISLQNTSENTDAESIAAEFADYQAIYEEKRRNGQELLGLSTGFSKIDKIIDGLRKGHFWILGGYTNLGKTFGALNIAANLVKQNKRVVVYSLEMNRIDIFARILGILSRENGKSISKGFVDKSITAPHIEALKKSGFEVVTTKNELSQILLSMYEQVVRQPVDLFIVDYLGLVRVKGTRSQYEELTEVALELQNAAKRHETPIIALSQVNNDSAKSGEQMVMGFKGSGDIAAAADLAIELVSGEDSTTELRAKLNNGEPVKIKWLIKKNRHGPVGYVPMEFDGKTGISTEIDENNF